jgi:hypothetical protein
MLKETPMIVRFQSNTAAGRRRMLELGAWTADAVAQVRKRGMPAALELAATFGGLTQPKTFARSLMELVNGCGLVAARTIERTGQEIAVFIPRVTWRFHGRRQMAVIDTRPAWCAKRRAAA